MSILGRVPPRSALLVAWGSAWLAGDVALPEVVARVGSADADGSVAGLESADLPLGSALAALRASGVCRLRLVLPVPGDALGLPGPGPFTAAALDAGEGVLAGRPDGTAVGLVPAISAIGTAMDGTVTVIRWQAWEVTVPGGNAGPFLHEADHDLRRGVVEAAAFLRRLDVARWRPELTDVLADLRRPAHPGLDDELPGGYPIRARELLIRCRQLAGALQLAGQDHGGAVDAREAAAREATLRTLAGLVRRARVAACNAYGEPGAEALNPD